MSAGNEFARSIKGKNIMTPDISEYGYARGRALIWELSTGRGIFSDRIWGVTVIGRDEAGKPNRDAGKDLSKCCHSLREAREHIVSLDEENWPGESEGISAMASDDSRGSSET